jgi:hypothetical protein
MKSSSRSQSQRTLFSRLKKNIKRRRTLKLETIEERRMLANFGFEDPISADGVVTSTGIPDWENGYYDVAAPTIWVSSQDDNTGVWNPDAVDGFSGGAAFEGENTGWATSTSDRDTGLRQILGTNLEANREYQLSAQIGNAFYNESNVTADYRIELLAGGVLLDSDSGTSPVADTWELHGLTYNSGANPAQLGQPLEIRLIAERYADGGGEDGYEVDFDAVSLVIPIAVPNPGFEDRTLLDEDTNTAGIQVMPDGFDRYNQWGIESWRHFESDNNGGPLRIWNPGDPANGAHLTTQGIADVGFGGNAAEGDYMVVVRSRYNDDEFHVPPQVRDFEAATQLLTETFDPTMPYTLTAQVGRLPDAGEGGSVNYDPEWFGYSLQLAVGGTNVGGARYAGRVEGGTIIAQDLNTLTVPANGYVTSTVIYTPDPAHANLAGEPLQIRLAALENPNDHSLSGWAAFDDVKLFMGTAAATPPPSDTTPPEIANFDFNIGFTDPVDFPNGPHPTNWDTQRSEITNIQVEFSEDVTLDVDDLRLTNLGVNGPQTADVEFDLLPSHLDLVDNVLTLNFVGGELDDGSYRLEVLPTATDSAGNPLDGDGDGTGGDGYLIQGDAVNNFFQLEADWNGDGGGSVFDFTTYAYWFGSSTTSVPFAPSYVDLNKDEGITVFDFSGFSNNFGSLIVFQTGFAGTVVDPDEVNVANIEQGANDQDAIEQVVELNVAEETWTEGTRRRIDTEVTRVQQRQSDDELDTELETIIDSLGSDIANAWS